LTSKKQSLGAKRYAACLNDIHEYKNLKQQIKVR